MAKRKTDPEAGGNFSEWFRTSDDVRTGYISGITFGPKQVEYSVINDRAIFEGDIYLGTPAQVSAAAPEGGAEPSADIAFGVAITGERYRWPRGEVPYDIDPALPNKQRVIDAIAHWVSNTNIRFPLRTTTNAASYPNYIHFFRGDGCWSSVGMQGNKQDISLADGCGFGAAVHEIGHAVGLWHEQSREDRGSFVTIRWENITPAAVHNFNQHITDGDDVGNYDFGSIMHYGATAFSSNGQPTIVPVGGQAIGQRAGLSAGDIAAVRWMYPNLEPSRSWSGVQFSGSVPAGATRRWFTHSWPSFWYVVWNVIPTGPVQDSAAQLEWKVQVERQTEKLLKYYIEVKNLSTREVRFEARYTVLGWNRASR